MRAGKGAALGPLLDGRRENMQLNKKNGMNNEKNTKQAPSLHMHHVTCLFAQMQDNKVTWPVTCRL